MSVLVPTATRAAATLTGPLLRRRSGPLVRATQALEGARVLDPLARAIAPVADAVVAEPTVRDVLRGRWVGHAVHPPLTDVPIGFWASAGVLDLVGGPSARPAAQTLVALGVLASLPTAVTGLAEFAGTSSRDQRVGAVHAVANVVALGLYTASWRARRRGDHERGARLATLGAGALGVGGYLGGHLALARDVASRAPEFDS